MWTTIASFEHDTVRHLILAIPADRTGIVDTFCGRDFNRLDGAAYVGIPRRSEACADCAKSAEAIAELLGRP